MKNLKMLSLMAAALLIGTQGYAQESDDVTAESTMAIDDAANKNEATEEEVITNRKMLAEAGSKSKYSLSTSLGYSGGSIKDPLNAVRPNIVGEVGSKDFADLGGSVSGRYRLDSTSNLSAGVGITWVAPLETEKPEGLETNRVDASEPYLGYTKVKAWSNGVQSVLGATLTVYTDSFYRDLGYQTGMSFSANNVYEIGESGVSLGVLGSVGFRTFDKVGSAVYSRQSDYSGGIYPFLEYVINDTFNLRTISGVWVYQHRRSEEDLTFSKNVIYQSVGVGISVTRDIFLYPNVQFIPEDIRDDRTNVAMSASINLF